MQNQKATAVAPIKEVFFHMCHVTASVGRSLKFQEEVQGGRFSGNVLKSLAMNDMDTVGRYLRLVLKEPGYL